MVKIDTVLLKLASRCNLDCSYCYVYRMGDDGWKAQPKRMADGTMEAIGRQLAALVRVQEQPFSVVFHGGEPLLVGPSRFARLCGDLRNVLPESCRFHLQTNGILLTDEIIRTCAHFDVRVSISIDGPARVHDSHRTDHRGIGSHDRVLAGIRKLVIHPLGANLFSGVLAVVDVSSDPIEVYEFLKSTGAPSIDFLYRDGNHQVLPVGKASFLSTEYGDWMGRLLDYYLDDQEPTRIRVLDDMLKLLLGGTGCKEGLGLTEYGILVVETDGTIMKNDTLKSASRFADRFGTTRSILRDDLTDIVSSTEFLEYHHSQRPCAPECKTCPDLNICGGGMPAHRWSDELGFAGPSVFCADQRYLIEHMRWHLARRRVAA